MKKTISIMISIMVAATMSFAFGTVSYGTTEELSITVVDNTVEPAVEKTFTEQELSKMIKNGYYFSVVNNFGTAGLESGIRGIPIKTILDKAGVSVAKGEKITFKSPDKFKSILYYDEYKAKRYYYPWMEKVLKNKSMKSIPAKGPIDKMVATKGKKSVEMVIAVTGKDDPVTKLYFGQTYPGERNQPKFCDDVATGGSIVIEKAEPKKQCDALKEPVVLEDPTIKVGSEVELGTKIDFMDEIPADAFAYYTIDGKDPTLYSAVYNYNSYGKGDSNPVVLNKAGNITVKTVVKALNKTDSQISSFQYNVKPADPVVKLTSGKKLFKIKITNNTGASKYTVKYKAKGKGWKTVSMSGTSKIIKKVAKGSCQVSVQAVAGTMKSAEVAGIVKVK